MEDTFPTAIPPEAAQQPAPAKAEAKTEVKKRDFWDKLDIIFKFVGAVGTAVVVGLVGIFGSSFLADRQEQETNLRLYTELMSHREVADTTLRKEMFNSIIINFLKPSADEPPEKRVLNLELLAYNFHDSLDLSPLFKDVNKELQKNQEKNQPYIDRLERVTRDVIDKQVAMLREAGGVHDAFIEFSELDKSPGGMTVLDKVILLKSNDPDQPLLRKQVRVEVLSVDPEKEEVRVRLIVFSLPSSSSAASSPDLTPGSPEGPVADATQSENADADFNVGFFDFPMLDNVRIPGGYRCALVLNEFEPKESAHLTLVYFPGDRSSLKEKPYYDEILQTLNKKRK